MLILRRVAKLIKFQRRVLLLLGSGWLVGSSVMWLLWSVCCLPP